MESEDPEKRVLRLMREGGKPKPAAKPKRKPRPKAAQSIQVHGSGNVVAGRDVVSPIVRPRVTVKTGDGVIDASQKAELQRLIADWVNVRGAVRKSGFSYGAAWSALNRHFGVNKYAELPMEEFGAARAWLQRQIAIVDGMPSAPRKVAGWRGRTIGKIKARAKNQLGDADIYKPWLEKRFGKDSLTLLTDDELQATRQHVFGLKRKAEPQ